MLHRYWMVFDVQNEHPFWGMLHWGTGVTAEDEAAALETMHSMFRRVDPLPPVLRIYEDNAIPPLEGKVLRACGPFDRAGMWFPNAWLLNEPDKGF